MNWIRFGIGCLVIVAGIFIFIIICRRPLARWQKRMVKQTGTIGSERAEEYYMPAVMVVVASVYVRRRR